MKHILRFKPLCFLIIFLLEYTNSFSLLLESHLLGDRNSYANNNFTVNALISNEVKGHVLKIKSGSYNQVELSYFIAQVNFNNVTLTWGTLVEINNAGFYVQRKQEDSTSWMDLGFVPGHGTTNEPHDYEFNDIGLSIGRYNYRLKQEDFNGKIEYFELSSVVIITTISITKISNSIPDKFSLYQNYPNPFNPVTKIRFDITASVGVEHVQPLRLIIYDLLGNEVATLFNEKLSAGSYSVEFNGANYLSGIYFYKLETNNFSEVKKMILLK